MGIYNAQTVVAAQRTFQALFGSTVEASTPMWPMVAMRAPSANAQETYQWLGRVPSMKQWLDEKTFEQLSGFDYTIKNLDWEATLEVDRNSFEDDQLGLYRPRIQALSDEAVRHQDELVSLTRRNGAATLCYDGQFFYDTDHAEGSSGAQSNKLTGTGTTVAQLSADFATARAALRSYKDDKGKPYIRRMGNLDLVITCPPALEYNFQTVLNAALVSNTSNVLVSAAKLIVDPYLTDTNDWYLDYAGGPIKPYILQMRKEPQFVALDNEQASEMVFRRRKIAYSVEGRYNAGYGLWQYSVQITN